jgi:hypothetical protein
MAENMKVFCAMVLATLACLASFAGDAGWVQFTESTQDAWNGVATIACIVAGYMIVRKP